MCSSRNHQNISSFRRRLSIRAPCVLGFLIGATAAWVAGTMAMIHVCAIALKERPGFLGSWSRKGNRSETGASWLHQSQDTWGLLASCEAHPSPDLLHQLGWLLLRPAGGTAGLVAGNSHLVPFSDSEQQLCEWTRQLKWDKVGGPGAACAKAFIVSQVPITY